MIESSQQEISLSSIPASVKQIYSLPEVGLTSIASLLSEAITPPQDLLTVLLIGNHSAGKSSFVNWYTGTQVQSIGAAMETQSIELVLFGAKEQCLDADNTIRIMPPLTSLSHIDGIRPYLKTHVCPSQEATFHDLCFIDTPGLVDGALGYPFDINTALLELGRIADLIFIFFEPVGQTLCERLMNVVEDLQVSGQTSKMHFILNKADLLERQRDRDKVIVQTVQNLSQHFRTKTLSLLLCCVPTNASPGYHRWCDNCMDIVCETLISSLSTRPQIAINRARSDASYLAKASQDSLITNKLKEKKLRNKNLLCCFSGTIFFFLAVFICLSLIATTNSGLCSTQHTLLDVVYSNTHPTIHLSPFQSICHFIDFLHTFFGVNATVFDEDKTVDALSSHNSSSLLVSILAIFLLLTTLLSCAAFSCVHCSHSANILTRGEKERLERFLREIKPKADHLLDEYIDNIFTQQSMNLSEQGSSPSATAVPLVEEAPSLRPPRRLNRGSYSSASSSSTSSTSSSPSSSSSSSSTGERSVRINPSSFTPFAQDSLESDPSTPSRVAFSPNASPIRPALNHTGKKSKRTKEKNE